MFSKHISKFGVSITGERELSVTGGLHYESLIHDFNKVGLWSDNIRLDGRNGRVNPVRVVHI